MSHDKEEYAFWKSIGVCPTCGKNKPAKGRVQCRDCLDRESIRYYRLWDSASEAEKERYREYHRKKAKKYREAHKKAGLCIQCGKPSQGGYTRCERCRIKNKRADRERYLRKKWAKMEAKKTAVESIRIDEDTFVERKRENCAP